MQEEAEAKLFLEAPGEGLMSTVPGARRCAGGAGGSPKQPQGGS